MVQGLSVLNRKGSALFFLLGVGEFPIEHCVRTQKGLSDYTAFVNSKSAIVSISFPMMSIVEPIADLEAKRPAEKVLERNL